MKIKVGKLIAIAGSLMFCIALPTFGQQAVKVTLGNVNGDPIDYSIGGLDVYAGIYGGTANLTGVIPGIVCDDFKDEVGVPSSWGATAYQVSTLGGSNLITDVLYGGAHTGYSVAPATPAAAYAEVAYLVNMMFNPTDTATQGLISEAIWSITDPGLSGTGSAAYLVTDAQNYATSTSDNLSQYSNLYILTPSTIGTGQEMWIQVPSPSPGSTPLISNVPEGGTALIYLLLAGATCFGAVYFNSRSRLGRSETA